MIQIEAISTNLEMREPGVWFARSHSGVSYPESASSWCFEVEQYSFWFRHRNRCISTVLKRFPPAGAVFDIGGGNGFVTLAIRDMGHEAVLVEPSIVGVQNAIARGISPVICSTLEDAGFCPQTLPAAGVFDVVEHVADDRSFLSTLHRLLIPGGKLYITVPAYNILWSDEDDYAGHYRRYTRYTLVQALKDAGFHVEYVTYIFAMLPLPIFVLRSLPCRLGLRRGINVEQERREHRQMGGIIGRSVELLFEAELHAIRRGSQIPFGSSCMAVACT
ncbi:MAG: class I SAM-dependent methyltransferase [Chloroflexus sp.]|jgi:SAM-dependent methyltransferase|nr:class I SAM-dependent methyltransferase [Chloroflexus sp.]MBO9339831.1 class I SAM-dependent methyltransferase [Chloroflexus sp.]